MHTRQPLTQGEDEAVQQRKGALGQARPDGHNAVRERSGMSCGGKTLLKK